MRKGFKHYLVVTFITLTSFFPHEMAVKVQGHLVATFRTLTLI